MSALTSDSIGSSERRRTFLRKLFAAAGLAGAGWAGGASLTAQQRTAAPYAADERKKSIEHFQQFKPKLKITELETIFVQPRWLFLKMHTDAGIVGLGEPITEGRAKTCATAVQEVAPYLIGKDPRAVVHHWQAIYRHAFYRGGPILTSVLSGIEQALWDIKGKALGVPIYELLGGPTRDRVRVYAHARTPETVKQRKAEGFTAFKTGVQRSTELGIIASPAEVEQAIAAFAALREAGGKDVDIGIDFHGAISPQNAKLLIKGLEPYQPLFVEEPVPPDDFVVPTPLPEAPPAPVPVVTNPPPPPFAHTETVSAHVFAEPAVLLKNVSPPALPLLKKVAAAEPADFWDWNCCS
jgi:galactonate dehydratase